MPPNNHNKVDTYVHQGNIMLKKVKTYKVCEHYICTKTEYAVPGME